MIEIAAEVAKQIPAMLLMGFLVLKFLDFTEKKEKFFITYMQSRDASLEEILKHIGDDCHAVQRDAITAMNRNTEVLGKTESTLEKTTKDMASIIENHQRLLKEKL